MCMFLSTCVFQLAFPPVIFQLVTWQSQPVTPYRALHMLEIPDLELADDLKKTVCVRAGGTLRLMVFVTGRPAPVVAWRKTGIELQTRGYIETTDSYTSLMVEKVNRYDSGKYVVEAENPSGKKTATILVKVYGMSSSF